MTPPNTLRLSYLTVSKTRQMKTTISLLLLSCCILFAGNQLQAQPHANLKGTWNLAVETPMGSGSPVFELKHLTDSTLTGTYTGQLGDSEISGKIKGNTFYISFSVSGNLIEYDGSIEGDTMKGKVKLGSMAEGTFTGTRKKSANPSPQAFPVK